MRSILSVHFSFQPVLHDWYNEGCGMCYPVCGMVHIKEPFVTPVVEHWLEREIAQWVHNEGSIRRPISPQDSMGRVRPLHPFLSH